jgi:hypothetical protein
MSEPTPDAAAIDRARRNAADLVAALAFVALGVATFYGAWTMPRLENRGIHPLTAPGLLPGVLAAALILCGVLLAAKAWRGPAVRAGLADLVALGRSREAARTGAALALNPGSRCGGRELKGGFHETRIRTLHPLRLLLPRGIR